TIVFKTATGATLIGNADGERTVFTGDQNGNNNPDSGDLNRLMRFQSNTADGNSANAVVLENIDFTCVFTNTNDQAMTVGALMVDNSGDVKVCGCRFYGCWADGEQGGAAVHLYRSTVHFTDCDFRNNSANYRGGAVRLRSNDKNKGITTFERCSFTGNTNYHTYGGAIFFAHGKTLNIINSTIAGNTAATLGGAIFFNGADDTYSRTVNIVNSTIAGNKATDGGGQIASNQDSRINIVNSIVVSKDETTSCFDFISSTAKDKFSFVSGGYNYVGSVTDAVTEPAKELQWLDSDIHGDECQWNNIFGENTIVDGLYIIPDEFIQGASGAQVAAAVAEWGLPAGTDLSVDIAGRQRGADVTPGAYAATKGETVSIGEVYGALDAQASIEACGNGVFMLNGVEGATVYSTSGSLVSRVAGSVVDLGSAPRGIYIVATSNGTFKVIR
ncbi:MAG: hypothetical protein K2L49_01215, partial [Muribaculaceae bacterium]|nr:hypothetical protein [Muribaculaceae bacterium]